MFQEVCQSYEKQLYFQKSNLKADSLGVFIVYLPFEKPKHNVYIFNKATLSSFAKMELTLKEDLNKKNRHFCFLA